MMKTVLIFASIFLISMLIGLTNCYSQTPDSCLKLLNFPENSGQYNYDSIKVDSCIGSRTYSHFFAKRFFYVYFEKNVMQKASALPIDTIVEFTWYDIDTNYVSTKAELNELEIQFGKFWLIVNNAFRPDTLEFYKHQFGIRFENYVNIDSVEIILEAITLVKNSGYIFNTLISVPEISNFNKSNFYLISPNPATDFIEISYSPLEKGARGLLDEIRIYNVFGEEFTTPVLRATPPFEGEENSSSQYSVLTTQYSAKIDISALLSGVYFVRVGDRVGKFLKQ